MVKPDDLSRSLVPFEQSSTLVVVIEKSLSSWLVAGIVPASPNRRFEWSREGRPGLLPHYCEFI